MNNDQERPVATDLPNKSIRIYTPSELAEYEASTDTNWQIQHHYHHQSLVAIIGKKNTGKSFIALAHALAIATGIKYLNRFDVTKGDVIYINSEGSNQTTKRLAAWSKYHNAELPNNLLISPDSVDLRTTEGLDAIRRSIETKGNIAPKLIVFDTLARNFGDGDENTAKDMNRLVNSTDELRRKYGCSVLIIHHEGKDPTKGARGNSAFEGACNTVIEVEGKKEGARVSCCFQRDGSRFEPYTLKKKAIEFTDARNGVTETSLVFYLQDDSLTRYQELSSGAKELFGKLSPLKEREFTQTEAIDANGRSRGPSRKHLQQVVDARLLYKREGPQHSLLYGFTDDGKAIAI